MKQADEFTGNVVAVEHLSRRFKHVQALDDVSLQVVPGQVFGIVGENGAGKTTLIRHILGLYRAQAGSVRVFGEDPVARPESVLSRIGYLSEEPDLPGWMRISELLAYTSAFYPSWDMAYAQRLIELFELDPRQQVRQLSKGKRARVGLCLAQAHRPRLLLLDEPSSGLDPIVRRDILTAIIRTVVDEGRTVIFSSHLLDEVERVSDHLMMLSRGRVLMSEPMEDVLTRHHRFTCRAPAPLAPAGHLRGLINSQVTGDEWRVDCYGELDRIRAELDALGAEVLAHRPLSLSDVFIARTDSIQRGAVDA